jgi:hypothetical protein
VRSWPLLSSIIFAAQRRKSQPSPFVSDSSFVFAYQDICIVCHCGCDTQVWEQRFGRRGDLCARNLVRRRFVTGTGYQLFDDDELGLWPCGGAQVFQYGKTILISPVVKYFADEEDGDILLLRRLWLKEVVALVNKPQWAALGQCRGILTNLGASRDQIQVRRACSSSRTMAHVSSRYPNRSVGLIYVPRLHPQRRTRDPGQRSGAVGNG